MQKQSSKGGSTTASTSPQKKKLPSERTTKFEKYEARKVHRSALKNAPYNPRYLSDDARTRLRDNIKRIGIVEPPVWNQRTGNIVGGHQRVSVLDALERTEDYMLTVAVVDLDEAQEKEQNVFLNNPAAQGEWDFGKLRSLFEEPTFAIEQAGFTLADVYQTFGEDTFKQKPDELKEMADRLRGATEAYNKVKDRIASRGDDDVNYYMVVVFRNDKEREEFAKKCGMDDNKWVSGAFMETLLTQGLPKEPKPEEVKLTESLKNKLHKKK
jgi:hypothetical protein